MNHKEFCNKKLPFVPNQGSYTQVCVKFKDFSRTSKKQSSLMVFKDYKFMKNTNLQVKFLLQKCLTEILKKLVLET